MFVSAQIALTSLSAAARMAAFGCLTYEALSTVQSYMNRPTRQIRVRQAICARPKSSSDMSSLWQDRAQEI